MKSLNFKKTVTLLFTICMLTTSEASVLGVFGSGTFLDERADSIQLIKENVYIHLKDSLSHVSGRFWIHN